MFLHITITTKEKVTLKNFLTFFSKIKVSTLQLFKLKLKKIKIKKVTVLKSPHINKTAQEQFEFRFFTRQVTLYSIDPVLSLTIFKHIIKKRFPGVKITLICIFDNKNQEKVLFSLFNPDKIVLKKFFLKKYIQLFDFYGEICLLNKFRNQCIFSSVG